LFLFTQEENIASFKKFSKEIEYTRAKYDGTNRNLSVRVMTKSLRYAQQIIIIQAGTRKLGLG